MINVLQEINSKTENHSAVELLNEALTRARNGDIQNVVIFGTDGEGCTFNQFCIHDKVMPILGELRLVERDLIDLFADIRMKPSWDYCE